MMEQLTVDWQHNTVISGVKLSRKRGHKFQLYNSTFVDCVFFRVDWTGCDFSGCQFVRCKFNDVQFAACNLEFTDFKHCKFNLLDISHCNCQSMTTCDSSIEYLEFYKSLITNLTFENNSIQTQIHLIDCQFIDLDLTWLLMNDNLTIHRPKVVYDIDEQINLWRQRFSKCFENPV